MKYFLGRFVKLGRPAMECELSSLRSALAEKTAQVERLREALEDRASFYYEQ